MATEEGSGGMEDVEESLEPDREKEGGIMDSLSNAKDRVVGWGTVDEPKEDQGVAGTNLNRRGFLTAAGSTLAAGYGVAEATDGDGWNVDWSSGAEEGVGVGDGQTQPGAGNETDYGGNAPTSGDNQLGVQGDVSDELYLQEDGTVIAIDHGHKEWRSFSPENFPENEDLTGLYDEVSDEREPTDLAPPSLDEGVEVSKSEIFSYDTAAYDDMADESEWDLIFDSNPNYSGGN